jgi:glycerol uptake facilitator-like aquaporin
VFIFSPVSGATLNPAVSLGLAVLRKITVVRFAAYTIAQCLGATLGTLIARHIEPTVFSRQSGGTNALSPEINPSGAFLAEFMGTFLLVTVVLCAIDESRKTKTLP